MKVTVLGSGNGGLALAFDYAQHGHEVSMTNLPARSSTLEPVADAGGTITATGELEGSVRLAYVGTDVGRATEGAELLVVAGPAYATEPQARFVAPHLRQGQAIVVVPTSCVGSAAFAHAAGIDPARFLLGETSTLPYAVRITGPARINVFKKIDAGLFVAGYPRGSAAGLVELLSDVYPTAQAAESILQTTLQNGNPVIHPAVTLLNAARIESDDDFDFYWDGVSVAVGRLIRGVDRERIAIGRALGLHVEEEPSLGVQQGYMVTEDYDTGYSTAPGFQGIKAQDRLDHRYLTEDVGYSLCFFRDLAQTVGVETPTMDAVTRIASVVLERDFDAERARTLESVGLGGLGVAELVRL